jgi:hypothetical protein
MKSITLTEPFLRALGEGVQNLYNGDPSDRPRADEVVSTMKRAGFILVGRRFVSASQVIVRSHFHPDGEDYQHLTPEERHQILAEVGVERWDVQSSHLIEQLAYCILDLRVTRGLPKNPQEIH